MRQAEALQSSSSAPQDSVQKRQRPGPILKTVGKAEGESPLRCVKASSRGPGDLDIEMQAEKDMDHTPDTEKNCSAGQAKSRINSSPIT